MRFELNTCKICICLITIGFLMSCDNKLEPNQVKTKSGLIYEITRLGYGDEVVGKGDKVKIHQVCTYKSGKVIFSTQNLGYPVTVTIGDGTIVKGVDQGLRGMKEGEIRKLIVPPELSRRSKYSSNLHPDSTLYYTLEVLEIR